MSLTQYPPKYEDEEHQQHAEGGHVVHGLHEDDELALEGGHEAHQLQHSHEPKGPQDREAPALLAHDLPHAERGKKGQCGMRRQSPMQSHRGEEAKEREKLRGKKDGKREAGPGQRGAANASCGLDAVQARKEQSPTRVSKSRLQISSCRCNYSLCLCQKPDSYLIGHWLCHLDARLPRTSGRIAFCAGFSLKWP